MFTGIITHIGTVQSITKADDWTITIGVPPGFMHDIVLGASISCSGTCLTVVKKTGRSFTVQASAETLSRTTLESSQIGTPLNLERALRVGDELGGHFVAGHVDGRAFVEEFESVNKSKVMVLSCRPNLRATARKILDNLTPRERNVLGMRFGIYDNMEYSFREIDQQFATTRERIRKIEANSSRKLGKSTKDKTKSIELRPKSEQITQRLPDTSLIRFIAPKGSVTLDGVSLTVNEVKSDRFSVNIIPHTLKYTTLGERKKGDFLNLEIDLIARYLLRFKESD